MFLRRMRSVTPAPVQNYCFPTRGTHLRLADLMPVFQETLRLTTILWGARESPTLHSVRLAWDTEILAGFRSFHRITIGMIEPPCPRGPNYGMQVGNGGLPTQRCL